MEESITTKFENTAKEIRKVGDEIVELVEQYIEMLKKHAVSKRKTYENGRATLYVIQDTKVCIRTNAINDSVDFANKHVALALKDYLTANFSQNNDIQTYLKTKVCYDILLRGFYVEVELINEKKHLLGYYMDDSAINRIQEKLHREITDILKGLGYTVTHYDNGALEVGEMYLNLLNEGLWKELCRGAYKVFDAETVNNILKTEIEKNMNLEISEMDSKEAGKIALHIVY